jgi:protein involved in polysaccharide export with SLBB domain
MESVKMKKIITLILTLFVLSACDPNSAEKFFKTGRHRFLSPDKVISAPEGQDLNWIVENMGDLDKPDSPYPTADRPKAEDWTYSEQDYRIGPGDILEVSVLDLYAEGLETVLRREVSASGFIDLPQLENRIKAQGVTTSALVDQIKAAYSPDILRRPVVSVNILARRRRTFSVLGSVLRPGTYDLPRPDLRLLDALALSGGVNQDLIEFLYVIRQAPAVRKEKKQPETSPTPPVPTERPFEGGGKQEVGDLIGGGPDKGEGAAEGADEPPGGVRWDYDEKKGQWVRVTAGGKKEKPGKSSENGPNGSDPFGWKKYAKTDMSRVIAIDLDRLRRGDYRMNVVIRENDIIHVPQLEMGEFYVMGEVLRPGVYSLTGRKITVKMALAAAGNLGPMAWPENSVLVRRIGQNQEQVIPLDIEEIMRGRDPDLYLKPNDIIAIGTHWSSTFLAVFRNAFRMTYGFGFIYDRNFSSVMQYGTPTSKRFKAW